MYGDANLPKYNDFLKVEECALKNGFNSSSMKTILLLNLSNPGLHLKAIIIRQCE